MAQGMVVALRFARAELTERIDAWAARQKDAPSRSEALRRLIEKALGRK